VIPDLSKYQDGIQFFRDTHKLVLRTCAELEQLLNDAESRGVFASFAAKEEWNAVFEFFLKAAPQHERDEERFLFPMITAKLPRMGFQQPDAPIRFLVEGHQVLQRNMEALVRDWEDFRKKPRDDASLERSHEQHAKADAAFIASGRELVSMYRDHVAVEEERVYSVADKVLTGTDRLALLSSLRDAYDDEAITSSMEYEPPQYTDPKYQIHYHSTDAVADAEFEEDEEEEDE
jgi:hemerythrin-like domain-containing protein